MDPDIIGLWRDLQQNLPPVFAYGVAALALSALVFLLLLPTAALLRSEIAQLARCVRDDRETLHQHVLRGATAGELLLRRTLSCLELINRMVEDNVYWVPTLELYHHVAKDAGNDWDQLAIENLRRFVKAGGQIALGTDFDGYGAEFDLGMPMIEIEAMVAAGMTPMQIIVAATANAAHVCNLDTEIGTLESGKAADILIVSGDPLKDLQALTRTLIVIHDGVVIQQ